MTFHIPPILRDVEFLGVEDGEHHTCLVFKAHDPSVIDGVVRVLIQFRGKPKYVYTIADPQLGVLMHYEGPYGDPSRDKSSEIKSIEGD